LQNDVFNYVLDIAEVSDLKSLIKLDTNQLQAINFEVVYKSIWGQFSFGPVTGTTGTPELPGQLLRKGKYFKDIKILHGFNGLEGLLFFPPWIRNMNGLLSYFNDLYPGISDDTFEKIEALYPFPFGAYDFVGLIQRFSILVLSNLLDVSLKTVL
jgi:hypothetical protein